MTPIDIVSEIQDSIDDFADAIDPIQKKLYNRVSALLKDLTLDNDGMIKRTASNLRIITDVKKELGSVVNNPTYQKHVASIQSSLNDVKSMQEDYFSDILNVDAAPAALNEIHAQAFDASIDSLTESGIGSNVVDKAADIISGHITNGTSYADMNDELRTFMLGDDETEGRLVSYSKQIINDTLHGFGRNYNSLMTDKLDLKWYQYVGAITEDSRPWCRELIKKRWIHASELPSICAGEIDGKPVSLAGLKPDTNKNNVIGKCGGYNCPHAMIPVSPESVPSKIRRKFENDVEADGDEKLSSRPKRKK